MRDRASTILPGTRPDEPASGMAGIGRLEEAFAPDVEELLAPYRTIVADIRARHGQTIYPGSPGILREILRRQDRGVLVELHPADHKALSRAFNQVTNLKVLHLDGWTALNAMIPPRENRGLVLIDPPYEETNELDRLGSRSSRCDPEMAERRVCGLVSDQGDRSDRYPRGSASRRDRAAGPQA